MEYLATHGYEVRCANLHRRKTALQFQWFKKQHGA